MDKASSERGGYSIMELNIVATGIELVGTTIKEIIIENNIIDVDRESKRSIGLTIKEPHIEKTNNRFFAQLEINFDIDIQQSENQKCKIKLSLEGAFISSEEVNEETFAQLVVINGASAIIGIARGKIETITAATFNNGKVVIPFINVVDYYNSLNE